MLVQHFSGLQGKFKASLSNSEMLVPPPPRPKQISKELGDEQVEYK